jgi:hypothetical protein
MLGQLVAAAKSTSSGAPAFRCALRVETQVEFVPNPVWRRTNACNSCWLTESMFLPMSSLLLSGCAQVNDQFYSKKNFTSQSFVADISECKRQNPSYVAIRSYVEETQDRTSHSDDAMVRECMKGKGYTIQVETK